MSRKTNLTVNNIPLKLDYFVEGYVYHVAGGIIASLRDTGAIKNLELTVDNADHVKIILNGTEVSLKPFPEEIIRSTLGGMVASLKGVKDTLDTLELKITA